MQVMPMKLALPWSGEPCSDGLYLGACERAVVPWRQGRVERLQRAHAFAVQADDLVLEVAEHALDLVVAPLVQGPAGRCASRICSSAGRVLRFS